MRCEASAVNKPWLTTELSREHLDKKLGQFNYLDSGRPWLSVKLFQCKQITEMTPQRDVQATT